MTAITTPRHRVSMAIAHVLAELEEISDASVWSLDVSETADDLVALTKASAMLAEVTARVAAHADDLHVGQEVGASNAANWLAHTTQTTRVAAFGTVKLGHDLESHAPTRDALAHGEIVVDQARVIIEAVDRLPEDVDTDRAEAHLLAEAQHHDAKALRVLGKHLFEVIAPDEADAREAAILEAEERAADRSCHLTMYDDGHGKTHGRFTLPTLEGAALRKMLLAFTAPKHQNATQGAGAERLPTPEAMGQAFRELILRIPAKNLPKSGGLPATLLVLIDEDSLMGRVEKAGILDTGEKISAAMARRLACQGEVIPVVLGGDSVPLDIGRGRRLHPKYQRYAMIARDRGCRAEGCDRTHGLHAHHKTRWVDGGHTSVNDGVTLCHWHHMKAHDTSYTTTYRPNGDVTFHRRQ